ncbi:MAG: hypothetical protein GXP62_02805, partial [Oligoflexia bacterium]|nr:hypothetical protein [Oligoflexia bacterium]
MILTTYRTTGLALAMMLPACSSQPAPAPKGCGDDPACFRRKGAALWAQDPTAVIDQILALSDRSKRAAVVEAVVEADPSSSPKLCPLLDPGITRQRCDLIASEPLLWTLDPAHPADAARELGEAAVVLAPGPTLRVTPFQPTAGPACGTSVPLSSCASWRASEAAMAGDLPGAAGLCATVPAPRWRQVCLFQAAASGCRAGQT